MSDNAKPPFPPPSAADRAPDPGVANRPAPMGPPPAPRGKKERGPFALGFGVGSGFALGMGVVSVVGSILFALSLLVLSLGTVAAGGTTASTQLTTIWGGGSQPVRAINVSGPILSDASDGSLLMSGAFGNEIAAQIDSLSASDARALVLLVNTPGGSIGGSKAISDAVDRYRERTGNKAFVHVTSMSASGGVYATASADEIIADHGALVGSIGVIFGPFTQYDGVVATTGTILESGVTTTGGITSEYLSQGKGKDFGNPYRPITAEERAHYEQGLANEYDNFVGHVAEHRGISADTIKNDLGAHLFDTLRAEEVGLIDATMGQEDFYWHVAESIGVDPRDLRVEVVRGPTGWEALLGVTRPWGQAPAASQGDGVVPLVSANFCRASQPLAFGGDLHAVCG